MISTTIFKILLKNQKKKSVIAAQGIKCHPPVRKSEKQMKKLDTENLRMIALVVWEIQKKNYSGQGIFAPLSALRSKGTGYRMSR